MNEYVILAGWGLSADGKILRDVQIVIEDSKITYFGKERSTEIAPGMDRYQYSKGFLIPPFINAHTHLPETLIRGLCDDADLHEWLYDHVWRVEPKMTAEDAKIGAELAAAEMISSGTIGFVDQYFYGNEIAEVVYETGMKALICPSIYEGNPESGSIEASYERNLEIIDKWHRKDNRIFIGFGPHAPYSVPDEWFEKIYEQAVKFDTKIHTHLNETQREVKESIEKYKLTPIEKMDQIGVLDRIVAAHCIHLTENDKNLLRERKVSVLHCIQSNLKIAAGIANIPDLNDMGVNVCLGTDGNASNNNLEMLEEVRLTALIHKGIHGDPKLLDTRTVLKMGTSNASSIFPPNVYSGIIQEGEMADLLVIDLDKIHTTPIINPLSNWVYSSNSQNIAMTISNGRILYKEGQFTSLDPVTIKEKAQKSSERMMDAADYTPKTH